MTLANALDYYRWSDNQKRYGKWLIVSKNDNRDSDLRTLFHLGLESVKDDEDNKPGTGNRLRLSVFGYTFIIAAPSILKPHRRWVDTSHYSWSTSPKGGYWDIHKTEYSISVFSGSIHLHYGAQTHDSETDKTKCWFYPWREHNQIRHTLYDLDGDVFSDLPEWGFRSKNGWEVKQAITKACPTRKLSFKDFDGEEIVANTKIEEREWVRGAGLFKWLRWVTKNEVQRSLDIDFSSEVGKRKGSWKGGTVGHSIRMLPGELHEQAFKRYCEENNLTYIGIKDAD